MTMSCSRIVTENNRKVVETGDTHEPQQIWQHIKTERKLDGKKGRD
jgi:hypothetical protein